MSSRGSVHGVWFVFLEAYAGCCAVQPHEMQRERSSHSDSGHVAGERPDSQVTVATQGSSSEA